MSLTEGESQLGHLANEFRSGDGGAHYSTLPLDLRILTLDASARMIAPALQSSRSLRIASCHGYFVDERV